MKPSSETLEAVQRMIAAKVAERHPTLVRTPEERAAWMADAFLEGGEGFPDEWKTGDLEADTSRAQAVATLCVTMISEIIASPEYKTRPMGEWADEMTAFALEELRKPQ